MKIWIDLTNSPHINFFKKLINDWIKEGHEVIITSRDLSNTIELIKLNNWKYHNIGGHAGKNLIKKILYFPKRVMLLMKLLNTLKPDIAISHSSFYSPVTSKLLGIPSIYINDNEHASGNYLAFLFASEVYLPECLKIKAVKLKWNRLVKIVYYPGIKESIYLSQEFNDFIPSSKNKNKLYVRPEPWTAQYYDGDLFFFDKLLNECKNDFEIHLLPRGDKQAEYYMSEKFKNVVVHRKPLSLKEIVSDCKLFIGAGGTMTREVAFLGIPTISIYQSDLLEVDKFLIQNQFMLHNIKPTKDIIVNYLSSFNPANSHKLHKFGIIAYKIIKDSIYRYEK